MFLLSYIYKFKVGYRNKGIKLVCFFQMKLKFTFFSDNNNGVL